MEAPWDFTSYTFCQLFDCLLNFPFVSSAHVSHVVFGPVRFILVGFPSLPGYLNPTPFLDQTPPIHLPYRVQCQLAAVSVAAPPPLRSGGPLSRLLPPRDQLGPWSMLAAGSLAAGAALQKVLGARRQ